MCRVGERRDLEEENDKLDSLLKFRPSLLGFEERESEQVEVEVEVTRKKERRGCEIFENKITVAVL